MTARKNLSILSTTPMSHGLPQPPEPPPTTITPRPITSIPLNFTYPPPRQSSFQPNKATITIQSKVKVGKSYADSLNGFSPAVIILNKDVSSGNNTISFTPNTETLEWLERSAFGILSDCFEKKDVVSALYIHGFHKANEGDCATNRRCWLHASGVPLKAWSRELFEKLVSRFGVLVSLAELTQERKKLDVAFIQVSTTLKKHIQWFINANISDRIYEITLVEVPDGYVRLEEESNPPAAGHRMDSIQSISNSNPFQLMQLIKKGTAKTPPAAIRHGNLEMSMPTPDTNKSTAIACSSKTSKSSFIPSELSAPMSISKIISPLVEHGSSSCSPVLPFTGPLVTYSASPSSAQDNKEKKKKINFRGSIVSSDTLVDSDVRRVNRRLMDHEPSKEGSMSFCDSEAEQTVEIGHQIGWVDTENREAVTNLAKELVVKEGFEWSQSRAEL
ncbi:hypothetical protein Tsubulata_028463 [Turnera subulata]|uniref:DUF4283 domain-containing protein n=1 Tax=Turnera subulata TaxID=218843 RepID=A0A9Q0JH31_9ROSI|nr:hypothetical protein Tsubulata_028463 [Turnera subulata]